MDKPGAPALEVATRSPPRHIIWAGLIGFGAGAVCWHVIGFWGFVNEAVFFRRGDVGAQVGTRTPGPTGKSQSRPPGTSGLPLELASGNCTVAVLLGVGGVELAGCEGPSLKFRPSRQASRADLGDFGPTPVPTLISAAAAGEPAVSGWSARIDKPE